MTEADVRLKDLFAEDAPLARDPAFSAAVMEKIVRRRFVVDVARLSGVTALGGLVLWAVWPALAPIMADLGPGLMPVAACVTLAVTAILVIEGRVTPEPLET
jgi:hypothetical protein